MGDGIYRTLDVLYLADANGGPKQHNVLLGQENALIPMPVLVTPKFCIQTVLCSTEVHLIEGQVQQVATNIVRFWSHKVLWFVWEKPGTKVKLLNAAHLVATDAQGNELAIYDLEDILKKYPVDAAHNCNSACPPPPVEFLASDFLSMNRR